MRIKYSRVIQFVGLVYFIFFFIPIFFEKPKLRSSDIDLERQIDNAFNINLNKTVVNSKIKDTV
jgi:hypothetical protein